MTFEEFVSARLNALARYATVVTWDPHLAEDILQNVLVRAQERWSRIEAADSPEAYVKRMVVNEFLSWRRRRVSRVVLLPPPVIAEHVTPAPDMAAAHDARDAMLRIIATLPPRQRAVVALRFYEDMTIDEIADVLGCRSVTVRTHLSRALSALRDTLPTALTTVGEL